MSECQSNTGKCEVSSQGETTKVQCEFTQALVESCCPVEKSLAHWASAFPEAMKAAQADILKEKIRKNWGTFLDKEADAWIEAIGKVWQASLKQSHAGYDLREAFRKLYEDAAKKQ